MLVAGEGDLIKLGLRVGQGSTHRAVACYKGSSCSVHEGEREDGPGDASWRLLQLHGLEHDPLSVGGYYMHGSFCHFVYVYVCI